ncbi:MAG: fumarylacetoacetate hydrolase family protein [Chloroflexi bacterium]|nr:fumarylacetoacetate hydrolase family protein [Chloroflexota bacterium]
MPLVMFKKDDVCRLGAVREGKVVDLYAANSRIPSDMLSFLEAGEAAMEAARTVLDDPPGSCIYPLSEVTFRAPVPNPRKVFGIGLNYTDHAVESGRPIPPEPVLFNKLPTAIIGPNEPILLPEESDEVDYEVELVCIIGKRGRRISKEDAYHYIAGYTVGNDVSARDWQLRKPGGQWLLGKTFDTFGPIGPVLALKDEVPDPHNLKIMATISGELLQDSNTNEMIFKMNDLVAYISQVVTLEPGDLIFTGTPPGVGNARKPRRFLREGDVCELEIQYIGKLVNPVRADKDRE